MTMSGPRTLRLLLALLLLGLLMSVSFIGPASAADGEELDPDDLEPAGIALRLSPAVLEVPYTSGPSRHELRVDNLGTQPLRIVTQLEEFTVTEDGTTLFLGPDAVSATSWASLNVDTFELAPSERRDVVLTVDVPADAEPGERYVSAIFVVPGEPSGSGNISVTHRVAVKLFIEVPGERIDHLELGELIGPRLIDAGSAAFELTVHNHGNVHRRFEADERLLATRGDTSFPFENLTILGNSTRVVEAVWPNPPMLCWCTVQVEIDDGRGNVLTASTRVVAFPLRLSLALVVLTVGLAVVAVGRRRGRTERLERKLETARGKGATPTPKRDTAPATPFMPAAPPAQRSAPAVRSAQYAATVVHPPLDATTPIDAAAAPQEPSKAGPDAVPLDTRMFTAQGPPGRASRRRRRSH